MIYHHHHHHYGIKPTRLCDFCVYGYKAKSYKDLSCYVDKVLATERVSPQEIWAIRGKLADKKSKLWEQK